MTYRPTKTISLLENNCEQIFQDKVSGVTDKRKGVEENLQYVRSGDNLMV